MHIQDYKKITANSFCGYDDRVGRQYNSSYSTKILMCNLIIMYNIEPLKIIACYFLLKFRLNEIAQYKTAYVELAFVRPML